MHGFVQAALGYPTALFSFALVVVTGYWGLVLLGGLGVDALDGGEGADPGLLAGLGLGGVPAVVAGSLMVAVAWFVSLAGSALTTGAAARTLVLAAAVTAARTGTRLLLKPVARLFPPQRAAARHDFVGRLCVIRTGRVTDSFGQAEVTAQDGSSAVIQVRTPAEEPALTTGRTALVYDYDADGEHFLVAPFDPPLLGH